MTGRPSQVKVYGCLTHHPARSQASETSVNASGVSSRCVFPFAVTVPCSSSIVIRSHL